MMFSRFISALHFNQGACIFLAALTIFLGPFFIKKKYLKRRGIEVDEALDEHNSWLFVPKQYNTAEKILMILVYVFSFFFMVLAVIIEKLVSE